MVVELSGKSFGKQLLWHATIFVAAIFGVPLAFFIVGSFLAGDSTTPDQEEIVETMRLSTGSGFGVVIYLALILSFIIPSWRRMRTLGLPGCLSLVVFVFFFMDSPIFVSREETRIFGSSLSSASGYPVYLMSALSMAIAMVLAGSPQDGQRAFRRFGYAGFVAAGAVVSIFIGSVLFIVAANAIDIVKHQVENEQEISWALMSFIKNMYWFLKLSPFACLAFMVCLGRCVVLSRREMLALTIR